MRRSATRRIGLINLLADRNCCMRGHEASEAGHVRRNVRCSQSMCSNRASRTNRRDTRKGRLPGHQVCDVLLRLRVISLRECSNGSELSRLSSLRENRGGRSNLDRNQPWAVTSSKSYNQADKQKSPNITTIQQCTLPTIGQRGAQSPSWCSHSLWLTDDFATRS